MIQVFTAGSKPPEPYQVIDAQAGSATNADVLMTVVTAHESMLLVAGSSNLPGGTALIDNTAAELVGAAWNMRVYARRIPAGVHTVRVTASGSFRVGMAIALRGVVELGTPSVSQTGWATSASVPVPSDNRSIGFWSNMFVSRAGFAATEQTILHKTQVYSSTSSATLAFTDTSNHVLDVVQGSAATDWACVGIPLVLDS